MINNNEMVNKTSFGAFIRAKRLEQGLTQQELAKKLYLSESAVSKWEKGKSYPDITMIPSICKALDVSEHELIVGAEDSQYRKMKRESLLYRRISETFFWGFTGSYILALIVCVICDLAINRALTFSLTVFGALLTAFTFIPSPVRFAKNHKAAVYFSSTYLSLVLLFLICCLQYKQNWFGIASVATFTLYFVLVGPYFIGRYLPERSRRFTPLIFFSILFACLILLLSVIRITYQFNLKSGMLISLYCFILPAVVSLVHITKLNRFFKASIDVAVGGLTMYAMYFIVLKILTGEFLDGYYAVDFSDWQNYINGNIQLIVLVTCVTVSLVLLALGIKKKRK
ncbi:MAG: helix-turn-helix domain-containing protein [Clostridia bacterium]|nr:helix-turn-helix domain-containing protein [Clostridia bacterium]